MKLLYLRRFSVALEVRSEEIASSAEARGQEAVSAAKPLFTWREVMVQVRDGVHLQTLILASVMHFFARLVIRANSVC